MKNDVNDGKNESKKGNGFNSSLIFTRETFGMTILLFCGIVLLTLVTGSGVFAGLGRSICTFMYGTFGYGSFLLIAAFACLGFKLVFEKMFKVRVSVALSVALSVFLFFMLFHAVSTRGYTLGSYGAYISDCYKNAQNGISGYTFGGVISAIFVYPVAKLTTFVGAYVIYTILFLASCYLVFYVVRRPKKRVRAGEIVVTDEVSADVGSAEEEVAVTAQPAETAEAQAEQPQYPRDGQQYTQAVQPQQSQYVQQPQYGEAAPVQPEEDNDRFSQKNLGRKILFENGEFAAESYRRNMIFNESSYFNHPVENQNDYLASFSSGNKPAQRETQTYSESYQEQILNSPAQSMPSNYVFGEKPIDNLNGAPTFTGNGNALQEPAEPAPPAREEESYSQSIRNSERFEEIEPEQVPESISDETENDVEDIAEPESDEQTKVGFTDSRAPEKPEESRYGQVIRDDEPRETGRSSLFSIFNAENPRASENRVNPDTSRLSRGERADSADRIQNIDRVQNTDRAEMSEEADDEDDMFSGDNLFSTRTPDNTAPTRPSVPRTPEPSPLNTDRRDTRDLRRVEPAPAPAAKEEVEEEKPKHVWKKYVRPTLDLLDDYPENNNVNTGEIDDNKRTIVETLERFKITSEVANVVIGPAITRYDVIIADKTNIKRALNYRDALAMSLLKDNVNVYLNYSKGALSIEVPNNNRSIVGLKSILASPKFINAKTNSLSFALGKNVEGEVVCPDITKMPHLLVAGTTGSGKSICLSALLISLLYKYGPEELRLILVDPKQVEFISYDKLPHLMINEILYDVDKAIKALNWANKEMERRYTLFKEMTERGVATKNLDEYNAHLPDGEEKLPKIVIVLDEFGDLMLQAKKDIESRIIKLVQKARACGIHLILATQRPSVDCITGLIKSNLPTRIGFKVNSFDDSRTIFDIGGAEKLLGKGDMYFRSADNPDLARIQGCFIDTHEVQAVTDFIKANNETYFDQSVSDFINKVEEEPAANPVGDGGEGSEGGDMKIDETFIKALKYCVTSNQASVSMIQRRFPVGYIKACKIIDWMENMNYVTQSEGSKPRKVLMSKEEFINTYGDIDD